ncbi:hypothetical protein BDV96DRAFT_562320 [Lophiotrema nucula]|uniref:Peptidase S54 rhomboid domain-containing protein n=1 Tax=Lophiotrema nucula TaxID=690887 RepID=A0A6A5ZR92_9PLEO|nr:hypothetical protein BDV96DRAFT_562320 [Lophiotrema nucula]
MSFLLRQLRIGRSSAFRSTRTLKSRPMPSNFFSLGLGQVHHLPLSHLERRLYSSGLPGKSNYEMNQKIIYGLLGLNGAIFLYGNYLKIQLQQAFKQDSFGPRRAAAEAYQKFATNFSCSLASVKAGKWWTMITSTVTHVEPFHLLGNLVSFYFLAEMLAMTPFISPGMLGTIIVGSAVTGSVGYLVQRQQRVKAQGGGIDNRSCMGFSGAVMGVGTVAALLFPKSQVQIWGIIPVPLWLLMTGYFLYDGYYLNSQDSRTGHAGHLGGLAFGAAYYFAKIRGLRYGGF